MICSGKSFHLKLVSIFFIYLFSPILVHCHSCVQKTFVPLLTYCTECTAMALYKIYFVPNLVHCTKCTVIQSAKILFVSTKYEIIFVLSNLSFSIIAIDMLNFCLQFLAKLLLFISFVIFGMSSELFLDITLQTFAIPTTFALICS